MLTVPADLPAGQPGGDEAGARLERVPGEPVAVGGGSAIFIDGRLEPAVTRLAHRPPELLAGGRRVPLLGWGAPPPKSLRGEEYWWTLLPLPAGEHAEDRSLTLALDLGVEPLPLGELDVVGARPEPPGREEAEAAATAARRRGEALVCVAMATYDPDPHLLARQIESIRRQEHRSWICVISDDGSDPAAFAAVERLVAGDERFVVSRAPANAGFYRNFERALELVPAGADYVALCDQDDEWRADKLARLLAGLEPDARLVYSDMRIVDEGGELLSPTYWSFRENNHSDFGSLILANTVTGAASLFERSLLDDVLPFPPRHAAAYHDHWIAQVAMATGPISYVAEPLYDYVQHGSAAIGYLAANASGRFSGSPAARARITWERFRRRRYRLGWRQPYFNIYCRIALAAQVLELRLGDRLPPDRRRVVTTLLDQGRAERWLLRRVLEDGLATDETLGRERLMVAGLAWARFQATRRRLRALG